jgi:hypothetical protein
MMTTYSPDPLQGRICRDDQDTVTVTAREDPSERAGRSRPMNPVYVVTGNPVFPMMINTT